MSFIFGRVEGQVKSEQTATGREFAEGVPALFRGYALCVFLAEM
jgi:hypothetical protein